MPDNSVQLSSEEQKYFDTGGAESPEVSVVEQEPSSPAIEKILEKAPKLPKKSAKESKIEVNTESSEVEEKPVVVTKTAEQEQIDNLNAALREERSSAKERERRTEERLRLLQQVVEQPRQPQVQQQVQEIPDPDKDPMGALKHLLGKVRQGEQVQQQTLQQQQEQQHQQRIMGEAQRLEMDFLAQQPDYDATAKTSPVYNEASAFLLNMRKAELSATGSYNPMQINQILSQEALGLAYQSIQNGRNPGQVIMDIAKARGFAPQPKVFPQETEIEKVTRIGKGQEAGFSLSQASGSKAPNNSRLDAKTLASMSDDDFTAFVNKAKKSDLRSLMGD